MSGLAWTTSDASVVSLSGGDPPVLTALAAGHAAVPAGGGLADVTVVAGELPAPTDMRRSFDGLHALVRE